MKLNQDSITVNMVVKVHSSEYLLKKPVSTYRGKPIVDQEDETSLVKIQELIASGDFTAEYVPALFTATSTGTLIIEEKV